MANKYQKKIVCISNNSINYTRNIDKDIKDTIEKVDEIEKEMINIQNKIRLLLL